MNACVSLDDTLRRYAAITSQAIEHLLDRHAQPPDYYGMIRYHMGWADEQMQPLAAPQGKRLRAALLLLLYEACGGTIDAAASLAAAVELLHNFSLVHDDIEDASATRRHRPTLWSLWGTPLGINAGDGLYALAHLALYDAPVRRTAPERFIVITQSFTEAALQLSEGQHLDMSFEGRTDVTVHDYMTMIGGKTAALMALASWIGAYAAGVPDARSGLAHRFGRELGLAFQMQDDILGIWGDEATIGKSTSSDIESRKKTLPILLAMEQAAPQAAARLRVLYAAPSSDAGDAEIVRILDESGAREMAATYMHRHSAAAMAALDALDVPPHHHGHLASITDMFVDRSA